MCDAKHFLEQPAVEDSRVFAQLGRTLGWQGLTDEAKHNEQNPGRAITKAGINAALWYLGGEAGSALGGAAAPALSAADESAGLSMAPAAGLLDTAGGGSQLTAQELKQMATAEMTNTGLLGTSGGASIPTQDLLQMAPVTDLSAQAGAPVVDHSVNASPMDWMRAHFSPQQGGNGAVKNMALNMGAKMLMPGQQPQQPHAMPMGGSPAPMPNPYGQPQQPMTGQARVVSGNGLTEQQKAALRAQGYTVY